MRMCFLILLSAFFFGSLSAQNLAVNERRNLQFGDELFPGIDVTVAYTEEGAASWEIIGDAGEDVRVTLQLPSSVIFDIYSMDVTFGSTSAGWNGTLEAGQATATAFDPKEGVTASLGLNGSLFIWLGGTVTVSENQQSGTYTGDIVLDAEYAAN